MRIRLRPAIEKVLQLLRLSPVSLAGKCRLGFGLAVLVILALALLIPYFWMGKLTEKAGLDAGRAVVDTVYQRHFRLESHTKGELEPLLETGGVQPLQNQPVHWVWLSGPEKTDLEQLGHRQKQVIDFLKEREGVFDRYWLQTEGVIQSNYIRLVRASESCISCHNAQGPAAAFNLNEPVGAIIVQTPAPQIGKTILMNRICITVAGLLAAAGAIIAFYIILQRVVLRPIRQLRALANNVAEGNLDVRSAIETHDEFERLSAAFNHMLDSLEQSQEKLRQANKQLDAKIAQLSDRNIELFKANKLKSEFLANISHEFRTPLNAILGFAEILRETTTFEKKKFTRYAENIIASGRTLLNMINDLLEMAKAETGKIHLHLESTAIPDLVRGLAAFFSPLTEQKKIKVKLQVDNKIPIVQTDPGKLQQILYNFLTNAIKFTPEKGKIEIRASMTDEKTVRVSVSDTGPGILEADREKIFEKFRQLDGSITRRTTGTGLGLAISRELAELLCGSIGVEDRPGGGATFWLEIPVLLQEAGSDKQAP